MLKVDLCIKVVALIKITTVVQNLNTAQLISANSRTYKAKTKYEPYKISLYEAGWPSGLRRCVQVAVSSDAWVRIPLLSIFFLHHKPIDAVFFSQVGDSLL